MNKLCRLLSNCFYLGELPAGGTWGSAVGLALAWFFNVELLWLLIALTLIGYVLTLKAHQVFGTHDPGAFVMDEVCGMMLSVLWLPKTALFYAAAFILFRILDIFKPWPIVLLQKMKHPFSIMHDDVAAGVFTNLILLGVLRSGLF